MFQARTLIPFDPHKTQKSQNQLRSDFNGMGWAKKAETVDSVNFGK